MENYKILNFGKRYLNKKVRLTENYISINKDNTKVTAFANINGILDKVIPYISHEKTPVVKIINILKILLLMQLLEPHPLGENFN